MANKETKVGWYETIDFILPFTKDELGAAVTAIKAEEEEAVVAGEDGAVIIEE